MNASSQKELTRAWTGILLAPLAWVVSFEVKYVTVPFACQSRSSWLLHVVSLAALAVAGAGFLTARRTWEASGKAALTDEADPVHRNGFLGMFGLLFSGIVIVLIAAQWIPVFFLDPCNP